MHRRQKILANHIPDKGLIFRTYEELYQQYEQSDLKIDK